MNLKPSKSAKKRDAKNVQSLGERLLELTEQQLAKMPMDDDLRDLIMHSKSIRSHSAQRRQRMYLAKVMRNADTEQLQSAVDALEQGQNLERQLFHRAERWRDRLVSEGAPALQAFNATYNGEHPELARLLHDIRPGMPEASRRQLSRQIFRQIHVDLAAAIQKSDC
ncbi:MAG: ribosome biogenesis factor YjgA [Woeseia sp.]